MTAAVCSRRFSSGGSRSMRAASTACTVAGTWMARQRLRQAIGSRRADQHARLHQGPHALLQEEGVALGARDQQPLERRQAGIVPEQGLEELVGARRRQRVEPQLGVVGLAAPAVLVLGAIVDQQEDAGRRQALDQAVQQGLGLGIDPVQVLKDQQQRAAPGSPAAAGASGPRGCAGGVGADRGPATAQSSTGTSRSAEEGGQGRPEGRDPASAACPVTFSRIVRASSRASIWQ